MVRGCQRKVIFLKNTESKIFSEAYFIVDDKSSQTCEADMVREANRIIEENLARGAHYCGREKRGIRRATSAILRGIPAFVLGGGVATVLCLIFL
jgi:hypothetical protein